MAPGIAELSHPAGDFVSVAPHEIDRAGIVAGTNAAAMGGTDREKPENHQSVT
jgi:hypothetical protein